jgi:hypothetical protein
MNHLSVKEDKVFFAIRFTCDILVCMKNTLKILDFFYHSFKLN